MGTVGMTGTSRLPPAAVLACVGRAWPVLAVGPLWTRSLDPTYPVGSDRASLTLLVGSGARAGVGLGGYGWGRQGVCERVVRVHTTARGDLRAPSLPPSLPSSHAMHLSGVGNATGPRCLTRGAVVLEQGEGDANFEDRIAAQTSSITKIQATQRGKASRRSREADENAATKIQARQRGKASRRSTTNRSKVVPAGPSPPATAGPSAPAAAPASQPAASTAPELVPARQRAKVDSGASAEESRSDPGAPGEALPGNTPERACTPKAAFWHARVLCRKRAC